MNESRIFEKEKKNEKEKMRKKEKKNEKEKINKKEIKEKEKKLVSFFQNLKLENKKAVIAFSGGVDSSVLSYFARETKDLKCVAVTFKTEFVKKSDIDSAKKTAKEIGIEHVVLKYNIFDKEKIYNKNEIYNKDEIHKNVNEKIIKNDLNRCYFCKKNMYGHLKSYALENGFDIIIDGTNFDDSKEYRPGKKALEELQNFVLSPLNELKITKEDVRKIAKVKGLSVFDKTSESCLATRFEYEMKLDKKLIKTVDKFESFLKDIGFSNVRVRVHSVGLKRKKLFRIEVDSKEIKKIFKEENLISINKEIEKIKEIENISYVTIDLIGFKSGSMDY